MKQSVVLPVVDFGHPEAEHDLVALRNSFYESEGWRRVDSAHRLPFLVGRKGSGKSALATHMEMQAEHKPDCSFLRIVPSDFRHVEIRSLLSCLVSTSTSWQYIYSRVWEGILIGQIVQHLCAPPFGDAQGHLSDELSELIGEFRDKCGFYVAGLDSALSDVLAKYVRDVSKKTDELTLVELRQMLEPYQWAKLLEALACDFTRRNGLPQKLIVAIDGLDEHWDASPPSLFFLAQLLAVTKKLTAKLHPHIQFLVCLRDNIFRALVDTKSVEYDKIESLVINLQWTPRALFELIACRVCPRTKPEHAITQLRELLPDEIDGVAIEDHLGAHILNRPRDYVNFFRMLQSNCGSESRAGEGHVRDTLAQYCANRLMDLDNEFGLTYPGISKCITAFAEADDVFSKDDYLRVLTGLLSQQWFQAEAADLVTHYGQPVALARVLISIGVVGCYDQGTHALRFVHEFSESRVVALWEAADNFGVHPVYQYRRSGPSRDTAEPREGPQPAILTHPSDYLPSRDAPIDIETMRAKKVRRREDLLAELASIDKGQAHFHRWEAWVRSVMSTAFAGDLVNAESQIPNTMGTKRFEIIYDIVSAEPPWQEITGRHETHRLLVECKNTDTPTDADFSKLLRDMDALDLQVAFLAFRSTSREPKGKILEYQRSRYINSSRKRIIIVVTEGFLTQCLRKRTEVKCRQNLNSLWRDHVQRWLVS